MLSYHFTKYLLVRVPTLDRAAYDRGPQYVIDQPVFRGAIYFASRAFYKVLVQADFQFGTLTDRQQVTLRKYMNRACFRPIPFGLFASVSLIEWGEFTNIGFNEISLEDILVKPSQATVKTLSKRMLGSGLPSVSRYEPNPTIYRAVQEYRFIRVNTDQDQGSNGYLLQSMEFSSFLGNILLLAKNGSGKNQLVRHIARAVSCSLTDAKDYFDFLVEEQLLVNTCRANITGPDHLAILLNRLSRGGHRSFRNSAIKKLLDPPVTDRVSMLQLLEMMEELVSDALRAPTEAVAQPLSVILNRRPAFASFDQKYKDDLRHGIFALDVLCPPESVPGMQEFINEFNKHFEGQRIPLLIAMDPQIGIGYHSSPPGKRNELLETLNIHALRSGPQKAEWSAVHTYLMECWVGPRLGAGPVIRLDEARLQELNDNKVDRGLLGMTALFRVMEGGTVYLENAGGINAPALLGRFTKAGGDIALCASGMAREQEERYPELIFAEVISMTGTGTDDVNHRECVYSWEIPVTAASTLPCERQLALADLTVGIEKGKVVLRSESHGKIVIPTLTSAYNHHGNKLPIFRFLADIAYQYGRSALVFDLRHYFPGLSFYPRVEYKKTIIYPATWVLSQKQVNAIREAISAPGKLEQAFGEWQLPPLFTLAEGDQQLMFRKDNHEDMKLLASCLKQKKEAVVREWPIASGNSQDQVNPGGVDSRMQFNAFILPDGEIDIGEHFPVRPVVSGTQRKFIPGSEWLYLKIYTSKIGIDRLLLSLIPLTRRRYAHGKIMQWFFIRYEDPAVHIRLRLKIKPEDVQEVLNSFKDKLETHIFNHVIREYQVDIYSRELERYGHGDIEATEKFFWGSSELVAAFLRAQRNDPGLQAYIFALVSIMDMVTIFLPEHARMSFFLSAYQGYLPEFGAGDHKVGLDQKYRGVSVAIEANLGQPGYYEKLDLSKQAKLFSKNLARLAGTVTVGSDLRYELLLSLTHMHLNRLFAEESRKQEMIIYYLAYKFLRSSHGRKNKGD